MIVTCDQCQTRFKIPDAKVSDRGVKVRCTKCQHTFRVTRPTAEVTEVSSLPPVAPPRTGGAAAAGADPFEQFGPTHGGSDGLEETRPGFFALGVAATRPVGQESSAQALNPWGDTVESAGSLLDQPTMVALNTRKRAPSPVAAPPDWFGGLSSTPESPPEPAGSPPEAGLFTEDLGADFGAIAPNDDAPRFEADHNLFEMPAPLPADAFQPPPESAFGESLLGDIPDADSGPFSQAVPAPSRSPLLAAPSLVPKVVKPTGRQDAMGLRERKPLTWGGKILAVGVNLLVAVVLVVALAVVGNVWMNGGRLDASVLSLSGLKTLFTPSRGMVARDVTNGLYETRTGRAVFFIRGDVENRSRAPGRVKVRAEIWDGSQLVGSAEGLAGTTPSPEELFSIAGPQDVDALNAKLEVGATVVPPGRRAPFLLTFGAYPPELAGLKLKVVAAAAP